MMRIAVIGAGVTGLVLAYRLDDQHQVTLYEAQDYLGGHVNTVEINRGSAVHAIDTGFIVFNDRNYPQFTALLAELGVASQPTEMSFSVQAWSAENRRPLEYNGTSLNGLFAQRANFGNPRFYRMLYDIVRFNRLGHAAVLADGASVKLNQTVQEYLAEHHFNTYFARHYMLPMGAAIWSCALDTFGQFPIRFVFKFFHHHGLLNLVDRPQWRVISGGSKTYVAALLQRTRATVRAKTPIETVRRTADGLLVKPRDSEAEEFDHVVFACHSDQALRLLQDPSEVERELLQAIPYQPNTALLHTDANLMPRAKRAWASWNYRLDAAKSEVPCVTYWMNRLQQLPGKEQFFVSLGAEHLVDPGQVLGRFHYEHPLFTSPPERVQKRHSEVINVNRTSFAGAYWGNGFHEDGVASAQRVAEVLQRELRAPALQGTADARSV